jgi:hypothetical protein
LANFKKTWHKSSLEGGNSSLFKKEIVPLQAEIIAKERFKRKEILSRTTKPNQSNLVQIILV